MQYFTLSNGNKIPVLGYGTYKLNQNVANCVCHALKVGYKHIDCAEFYQNQVEVGEGIKKSSINREDVFITSKVWNNNRGYEKTIKSCENTLKELKTDYLDLFLIHWPANEKQFPNKSEEINLDTWRAMIKLYKDGKIKSAGVSNFLPHHIAPLLNTEIKPVVNQIEFHAGLLQRETVDYCNKNGILIEGWRPLGKGVSVIEDATVKEIAKKAGKTPSAVALRWILQHGVLPLVKSANFDRIEENFNIFDFSLSDNDMNKLDKLPNLFGSGHNPDEIDF